MRLVFSAAGVLTLVGVGLCAPARAQCSRDWTVTNGVYDSQGRVGTIHDMVSWDPDGFGPQPAVLVVGGRFTRAGDATAFNVAYWDGLIWRPLGSGLTGPVNALAVQNGQLYAGGEFTGSGATPLSNFARWSGTAWQNAGGVDGKVTSLAVNENTGELLVGGHFLNVNNGATELRYVARYSNGLWAAVGTPLSGPVRKVAYKGGTPVVMREPASSTNPHSRGIIQWTGQWEAIGLGHTDALATLGNEVFYCGMEEHEPCDRDEYVIARHASNLNLVSESFKKTYAIARHNGGLVANATSLRLCGSGIGNDWMGEWDGTGWNAIGPTPDPPIDVLYSHGGALYAGGRFSDIYNQVGGNAIARLANGAWEPLSTRLNAQVRCATNVGNALYIGGDFTDTGGQALGRVAYHDGVQWRPYGTFNGSVYSMRYYASNPTFGGSLVVSGNFTSVSGVSANRIAQYNTTTGTFQPMGSGLNGAALAMLPINVSFNRNDLIVGGAFTSPGACIARWSQGAWQTMGLGMNGNVHALALYNGSIYAGGTFTTAGGTSAFRLARWTGTSWQPVGGGAGGTVLALAVFDNKLYVGGEFSSVGGQAIPYLAAWDGNSWSAPGGGVNGFVNALAVTGTELLVGGSFTQAGGQSLPRAASWNGTQWLSVAGDGTANLGPSNGAVQAIAAASNGDIVVGGTFTSIGSLQSPYAAVATARRPLQVWQQPLDQDVCAGEEAVFAFDVYRYSNQPEEGCQWYLNGQPLADGIRPSGTLVQGATDPHLTLIDIAPSDAGSLWCIITPTCGDPILSATAELTLGGPGCPPPPPTCGSADFDGDGDVGTDADIEAFFACLAGSCCPACYPGGADFNADGDVGTDADIESFFRVLAGGNC